MVMREQLRRAFEMVDTARKPGTLEKKKPPKHTEIPDEISLKRAKALRDGMKRIGIKNNELAARLGFTPGRVTQLKKGLSFPRTIDGIRPIARAVAGKTDALLDGRYEVDKDLMVVQKHTIEEKVKAIMDHREAASALQVIVDNLFMQYCLDRDG